MAHDVKVNGYAHPNANPASAINARRRQAALLLDVCRKSHPRTTDGRCALTKADR